MPLPGLPASVLSSLQSTLDTAARDILLKYTGQLSHPSQDPSMASDFIQSKSPYTDLNSLLQVLAPHSVYSSCTGLLQYASYTPASGPLHFSLLGTLFL